MWYQEFKRDLVACVAWGFLIFVWLPATIWSIAVVYRFLLSL